MNLKNLAAAIIALLLTSTLMAQTTPALENIFARKSVRAYTEQKVEMETLNLLIKAGMAAPSGMNKQPWEFIIVTDKAMLEKFAALLPYAKMAAGAPAAIVVAGNPKVSEYWYLDCSAATQNILLAAESLGLGAVWTAAYPYEKNMNIIKEVLSIPEPYLPLCLIPLGYPKNENKPKDKWKPEKVHQNGW
ncbi:MAG: nitroreductase family protein [Bacteroidetes bacterium HGW-Bacteroidetes-10]|nr:MAG: nitroreductase family protein [Bacteroidetes bacterium HGW-Bacteroidetes-10]